MDQIEWSRNGPDGLDRMEQGWICWIGQNGVNRLDGLDRMQQEQIGWIRQKVVGMNGLARKQQDWIEMDLGCSVWDKQGVMIYLQTRHAPDSIKPGPGVNICLKRYPESGER